MYFNNQNIKYNIYTQARTIRGFVINKNTFISLSYFQKLQRSNIKII